MSEPVTRLPDESPLADLLRLSNDTAKPRYQQLADRLTQLIGEGALAPGTTLPAERRLADMLSVSRVTVQRSYNMLREAKLLSANGRLGSIVQSNGARLHPGMDRLKGFTEEMRELGREPSSVILERRTVSDRSIASLFGESSNAEFLKLVRVRSGDGIPMSHEIAWYNLQSAPALSTADVSQSVYQVLRELGNPLVTCEQSIEAATPTDEECAMFGFAQPLPCLLIKRRSYGRAGDMIEYVEGLFRGDAYAYKLLLRA